ncbi:MAG: CHAT domain-containing protein, partial [Synechococcales bacterium]|nr:CHAT domain-containing protein [Synechococcales bacterium]
LQVSQGRSNLFLMNPEGIIFGANARLNLPALFSASTATAVEFANGRWDGRSLNRPDQLLGNPTGFLFAPESPGVILNRGQLAVQPGQSLSLIGGTVVNLGGVQAPGGSVTIAAVPGSNRVKLTPVGSILGYEVVLPSNASATPKTLPQLLANAPIAQMVPQLERTQDGKVLLKGTGIVLSSGAGTLLNSGLVSNAGTAARAEQSLQFWGEQIIQTSSQVNSQTVTLFRANRSILLQPIAESFLAFESGGPLTFQAKEIFQAPAPVLTQGRSLEIQAPIVQTQSLNTSMRYGQAGAVTVTGLAGNPANQVTIGNIITPNQDVQVQGEKTNLGVVITGTEESPNSSDNTVNQNPISGTVSLQGSDGLTVAAILTTGQKVQLASQNAQQTGTVQVGPIFSLGGDVEIQGDRITTSLIFSSPRQTDNAGNITLTALGDLQARQIEANGRANGKSGNVFLTSQFGNVVVDSIQAMGGQRGGNAVLRGETVRITGVRYEPKDDGFETSSIHVDESLQIFHKGGRSNQSFLIGNPTFNGSRDRFVIGRPNSESILSQGEFAVQAETTIDRPLSDPKLTIVAENTLPSFPELGEARLLYHPVSPGRQTSVTLAELGLPLPTDPDRDTTQLYIRLRPGSNASNNGGILIGPNGIIHETVPIRRSDRLTYLAPSRGEAINLYEVFALDLPPTPETIDRAQRIALRFGHPVIPQQESVDPTIAPPPTQIPIGSPLSNMSATEVLARDNQLSQEMVNAGFADSMPAHSTDGVELMQRVEVQTKTRPALVYLQTYANELEVILVTARGRFRRRVAVPQDRLMSLVKTFRREVTNPMRTHSKSYLPSAQQLYQWMIQPIESDLYAQGITNLIFLPSVGLRSLPYSALHNGKSFLVEQYGVAIIPSLGLTQVDYQTLQGSPLLAIGISESTQNQVPLPMVKTELATIGEIWQHQPTRYLNEQATLKVLQTARQRTPFQIIHLATHADFSTESAKDAYIQLWNERLRLDQIRQMSWNKPPLNLLVLSACQTALGNREAELGFAGLAVRSGVKTVVASLWSVNDTATTALISQFYDLLATTSTRNEALRQAQVAMIQGQIRSQEQIDRPEIRLLKGRTLVLPETAQISDPDFRHPYYWAAFTVIGNPW